MVEVKANVAGIYGMPGVGKSAISKEVAKDLKAVCLDNDIHGYPPKLRALDADRLGLESIDSPSPEMLANARLHAIALEDRVRDIASQGFDVVMQAPGEGFGHRGSDGKSLYDGMRERFKAAGCSLHGSYLVPLPSDVRSAVRELQISPDELEQLINNSDVFDQLCRGLDKRYVSRGVTEEQRNLDAPKINNPEFVRDRMSRVIRSMRESDMPGIPVYLDEDLKSSSERVLEVHNALRGRG